MYQDSFDTTIEGEDWSVEVEISYSVSPGEPEYGIGDGIECWWVSHVYTDRRNRSAKKMDKLLYRAGYDEYIRDLCYSNLTGAL